MNATKIYLGSGHWLVSYKGVRLKISTEPTPRMIVVFRQMVDQKQHLKRTLQMTVEAA